MTNSEIEMLGLSCKDSTELYDLFSIIKNGYLEKRVILSEDLIEDILSAMDGVRFDLTLDLEN